MFWLSKCARNDYLFELIRTDVVRPYLFWVSSFYEYINLHFCFIPLGSFQNRHFSKVSKRNFHPQVQQLRRKSVIQLGIVFLISVDFEQFWSVACSKAALLYYFADQSFSFFFILLIKFSWILSLAAEMETRQFLLIFCYPWCSCCILFSASLLMLLSFFSSNIVL